MEDLADEALLIMLNLTIWKACFTHVRSTNCNEISDFALDVALLGDVPSYEATLGKPEEVDFIGVLKVFDFLNLLASLLRLMQK